jgi:predicted dehydrogenase
MVSSLNDGSSGMDEGLRLSIKKLLRFARIYGPRRAVFKAAGRLRLPFPLVFPHGPRKVGIIGCGQFGFSTIGYFLAKSRRGIAACYDVDLRAAESLARCLRVSRACRSADELLEWRDVTHAYIASNHSTHASYAVAALRRGKIVYVEKPVALATSQLAEIERARRATHGKIFAGYNRPFSGAIRELRRVLDVDPTGGFSFGCFVAGHVLARDHWYRRPNEGTRVCGNLGHWIDLFLHILAWRGTPDVLNISLAWASDLEPDDNLNLSISSDLGDVCSIVLTSRSEPFEGINESIHIQHSTTLCKIDDFRKMTVWKGSKLIKRRYWPKDPGHQMAIEQPFNDGPGRDWNEVLLSTLLILRVTEMVQTGTRSATCSLRAMMSDFESNLDLPNNGPRSRQ